MCSVLHHLNFQKPTSQQGEKIEINPKIKADILKLCLIV
jgi:hypothetical protein